MKNMIFKTLKISLLLPLFVIFFVSCGDDEGDNDAKFDSTKVVENGISGDEDVLNEEVPIVCMWSAVSLKETPTSKGKYITTIYLGEVASTYGEIVTDSSTSKVRDYIKITLRDGTEGWIQENLMASDAIPHVIKSKTKIYKRPDILTAGKKEFDRMQFIVVLESQDDWVKVKGKRNEDGWFTEGWVKTTHITSSDLDINVAVLAQRALANSDADKKITALQEIVDNADLAGSQFIMDIEEMIEELMYKEEEPTEEEGVY